MRIRVGAAQVNPTVGDLDGNADLIVDYAERAAQAGCDIVCFPELVLTGYPPEDLLLKPAFIAEAEEALVKVASSVRDVVLVVGTVHRNGDLFNAAAVCARGQVVGHYHKRRLPNYGVFDEQRYFAAGAQSGPLVALHGVTIGITICEDLWVPDGPLLDHARAGAELALNVNGSPFHLGKMGWRRSMLATRASDSACPLVFVNMVGGQDELVFDGGSMLFDAEGALVAAAPQFEATLAVWDVDCAAAFRRRLRDPRPRAWTPLDLDVIDLDAAARDASGEVVPIDKVHPSDLAAPQVGAGQARLHAVAAQPPMPDAWQTPTSLPERAEEAYDALVLGVHDYLHKNGFTTAVVGLSGGIDSSLTAVIAADAIGADNLAGISMPSPYSSEHSISDARALADNLGMQFLVVPVTESFEHVLGTLEPLFEGTESGVAEENLQARLRGMFLMAFSNKFGAIVLSTGNKSEVATGYCTLYGDMAGGFAVLKDVPKTLVYDLARHRNKLAGTDLIPDSVLGKPPSAELRPDQLDSDSLPPYEVLDPILEAYVEHDMVASEIVAAGIADEATVNRIVRLVDRSEYKRRQYAPGVRITPKAFGRDRRLPVTNGFAGA
ncbi:MAG: NAD+ synthase [Acidimicrobiia bacterium]|nr:NAD+ synthase [Acidimicrobiia bacterium]